jgi:cytochrome c biogenesis protein CcdA
MKQRIENWMSSNAGLMGTIIFVFGYSIVLFLLGAIWQLEKDTKELQRLEMHTKIIEYRMGNVTLNKDTLIVLERNK